MDANLAKGSIQQCEQTQDSEDLMMASLEWDDNKQQLSLNDVAITECVGFTFLKSSNLAVSLHFDI